MDHRPTPQTKTEADPCPPPLALSYPDVRRAIFLVFGLMLLWHLAGPLTALLLLFLLVFIMAAVFNPVVVWLGRRGVPRVASAAAMVFLIIGFLVLLGYLLVPSLLNELGTLFQNWDQKQARLTQYYTDFAQRYPQIAEHVPPLDTIINNVSPRVAAFLGRVGQYAMNVVVGVFSLLLMMVLVIFTLSEPVSLITGMLSATPERYRPRVERALRRILEQLKNWAFGSLMLGIIIGVMTAIGLWVLGMVTGKKMPYILLFSVIAGVGELVPNIGPILSAIPPALVALTIDPMLALWVILLFILIQQAENNLIVPVVMGQSLNLHPLSVTFTVLVMGALFGLLGAILAVPVCAILKVCWEEFYLIPRRTPTEAIQAIARDIVENGNSNPDDKLPIQKAVGEAANEPGGANSGEQQPEAPKPAAAKPEAPKPKAANPDPPRRSRPRGRG